MSLKSIPATFVRGGTSKALIFSHEDMPEDYSRWDEIFLKTMGSPDSYGRQLNGMGGGVSSLSKACVISRSKRADADVDYTFAQVLIQEARVDYKGNCGNISSAVGPWAVEKGLVKVTGSEACVRIYNTNTDKVIESVFPVKNGKPVYKGDLSIPGVSGTGAPIRLNFLDPGGATTGKLLPTGKLKEELQIEGVGLLHVSMIDAANACVFVKALDVGLQGAELPAEISANSEVMKKLDLIRRSASVAMGISANVEEARTIATVPYLVLVSPALEFISLERSVVGESEQDLCVRALASGQIHQALPLTVSLCAAVAAKIEGSLVNELSRKIAIHNSSLRLGMPSGILTVGAEVEYGQGEWRALNGAFYRTARPLFEGNVFY